MGRPPTSIFLGPFLSPPKSPPMQNSMYRPSAPAHSTCRIDLYYSDCLLGYPYELRVVLYPYLFPKFEFRMFEFLSSRPQSINQLF